MSPNRLGLFGGAYAGRRVLVTGHTGFKGSWLSEWLLQLGADVAGVSLPPDSQPALFDLLQLRDRTRTTFADIRDAKQIQAIVKSYKPDFLFHLAAQSLVRRSYQDASTTWQTNVLGTVNVLESLRTLENPCAAIIVTSDKCYRNREWVYGYREDDALGGLDPYSASKAAAEHAVASWQHSYFVDHPVRIASVRAGNVIGGGDWALDRIVPDCIRAWHQSQEVVLRNPLSVRPWQHVLDPLSGYLLLASRLSRGIPDPTLTSPFNFGPGIDGNRTVRELVDTASRYIPGTYKVLAAERAPHEAGLLRLSIDKASSILDWKPTWHFEDAVRYTMLWYAQVGVPPETAAARTLTRGHIDRFVSAAIQSRAAWSSISDPSSDSALS